MHIKYQGIILLLKLQNLYEQDNKPLLRYRKMNKATGGISHTQVLKTDLSLSPDSASDQLFGFGKDK